MAISQMYSVVILTIGFFISFTAAAGMQEICQWETFEAKCQEDEVIVMKEAHYGRMRFGRCQHHKYFVGCSADVTDIMHARCSGRQHCSVPVPDPILFATTPCNKDLVSYLEAEYECVKVAKTSTDKCADQILTDVTGNIAKPNVNSNSKGTACPHRILAQPGQMVNVYLYDFYSKNGNTKASSNCITYGYVSEDSNTPTKICGGEFKKNHLIYSSDSNMVDITLTDESSHSHHYILHYEVVGCPTLQAPPNAFVKIEDNTATIMCNFSHIASELVCFGNEWVGEIQNCSSVNADLLTNPLSVSSVSDIFANSNIFPIACVTATVLFSIGVLMLIKARHMKAKQISNLPQTSSLEKSALPHSEKAFVPVDQYQPVYAPTTATLDNHTLHVAPQLGIQSVLQKVQLPVVENIYGPLNGERIAPTHTCTHSIYNITGLSLGEDNIINMDGTLLN